MLLADGREAEAAEAAAAAAGLAAGACAQLEEARCRLVQGRALAAGERRLAVKALEAACALAQTCGAERVHAEAVRELRRLGRRVGRGGTRGAGDQGLEALSGREREIADLVTQGLTNREIGARLFVSEKTVEAHLSRVFGKLGVRKRSEVAALVAGATRGS